MAERFHDGHGSGGGGTGRWVLIGFALIAGYFLLTEHRAHVFQYLPFLLVLACPLLHLFHGHGGHGGHGGDASDEQESAGDKPSEGSKAGGGKKHAGGCH